MKGAPHSAEITGERPTASATVLLTAVFLLFCCTGCVRQRIRIQASYRIEDNAGFPMLVPTLAGKTKPGLFQTSVILLPGSAPKALSPGGNACTIGGEDFSIRPGVPADGEHWIVRSPSVSGWNALRTDTDADTQWKSFNRDLIAQERGCFPSDVSIYSIRAAVAKTIPIPANEVPSFLYADEGENFINLVPGMRITIQKMDATGNLEKPNFTHPPQLSMAEYEVISRSDGGVALRCRHSTEQRREPQPGSTGIEICELSKRFHGETVLRLLLEGFSGARSVSDPVLLGASDAMELDVATDVVRSGGAGKCSKQTSDLLCMELPRGSVSIFSTVWINGHQRAYPFGTSLAVIVTSLPSSEQRKALDSIRVFRQLARNDYAEIQFPRTLDGAREVLLIPDDRVQWRP
jgi:hypothetical protein